MNTFAKHDGLCTFSAHHTKSATQIQTHCSTHTLYRQSLTSATNRWLRWRASLGQVTVLVTGHASCEGLLQAALRALGQSELDAALLAVAGPRDDAGRLRVTNTGLLLDETTCSAVVGAPVFLVNDFFAMAHGVPHFTQLPQIGGDADAQGARGLVGPGTVWVWPWSRR